MSSEQKIAHTNHGNNITSNKLVIMYITSTQSAGNRSRSKVSDY